MLYKSRTLSKLIIVLSLVILICVPSTSPKLETANKTAILSLSSEINTDIENVLNDFFENSGKNPIKNLLFPDKTEKLTKLLSNAEDAERINLYQNYGKEFSNSITISLIGNVTKLTTEQDFMNYLFENKPENLALYKFSLENPIDKLSKAIKNFETMLMEAFGVSKASGETRFFNECVAPLNSRLQVLIKKRPPVAEDKDVVPKVIPEGDDQSDTKKFARKPQSPEKGPSSATAQSPTTASTAAAETTPPQDDERPKVYFKDIIGIDSIIKDVQRIVALIRSSKNPAQSSILLGIKPPRGILLDGPPGTGKTMLAQAIATESGADVRFLEKDASTIMGQYVGSGPENVAKIFDEAVALKAPCIIFLDEIDSIGFSRTSPKSTAEHQKTVNALLTQLNRVSHLPIFILAATNNAASLDEALTRPGRFDRKITMQYLNRHGRFAVLKKIRDGLNAYKNISDKYLGEIADRTDEYIAGELKNIFNQASVLFNDAMDGNIDEHSVVTEDYVRQAFEVVQGEHKAKPKARVIPISRGDQPLNLAKTLFIELVSMHDCAAITQRLASFLDDTIKKDQRLPYTPEDKESIVTLVEQTEQMLSYIENGCLQGEGTVNIKLASGSSAGQPGCFTIFGNTIQVSFVQNKTATAVSKPKRKKNTGVKKAMRRKRLAEQRRMQKAQQQHNQDMKLMHQNMQTLIAQGEQQSGKKTPVQYDPQSIEHRIITELHDISTVDRFREKMVTFRTIIETARDLTSYSPAENEMIARLTQALESIEAEVTAKIKQIESPKSGIYVNKISISKVSEDGLSSPRSSNPNVLKFSLITKRITITLETNAELLSAHQKLEALKAKINPAGS